MSVVKSFWCRIEIDSRWEVRNTPSMYRGETEARRDLRIHSMAELYLESD